LIIEVDAWGRSSARGGDLAGRRGHYAIHRHHGGDREQCDKEPASAGSVRRSCAVRILGLRGLRLKDPDQRVHGRLTRRRRREAEQALQRP
jgi:hypothetical protein